MKCGKGLRAAAASRCKERIEEENIKCKKNRKRKLDGLYEDEDFNELFKEQLKGKRLQEEHSINLF